MVKLDWLQKDQRTFLNRGYLKNESPEQRYKTIATNIEKWCKRLGNFSEGSYSTINIKERFESYISKGWVSFSTPVLSNFGNNKGLPISCNFGIIPDSLDGILSGIHEVGMLAKYGAGTAKNFSHIRPMGEPISDGGRSEGVIPWIKLYSEMISKVTQGTTRRGFLTAYLSLDHKDIEDFLEIGTEGNPIQNITTAVTIPNGWRKSLKEGDSDKRKIWANVLRKRSQIGFPYILDEENCNKNYPKVYKDKNMWIDSSNICIEAIEYCDYEKEFACCLSSVNMLYYDDWKDNDTFLKDMYVMLDCVISEYIEKGKKLSGLNKAIKFASEHRAIGLGVLGFHSYLQSKMIRFGSTECYFINYEVFKNLRQQAEKASKMMAKYWGEPEILKGYGERNTSKLAQAPTKSTSFIMGSLSEGIQPIKSNFSEKRLAKIQSTFKNPFLEKLLESKGMNTKEIWRSILENNGSVQHLNELTDEEKDVFKTFSEVSQKDIIQLAAQRQEFIDMGQSINLMIHPKTPPKEVNNLIMDAFDSGVKSLYYNYSINAAQEFNKELLECSACES